MASSSGSKKLSLKETIVVALKHLAKEFIKKDDEQNLDHLKLTLEAIKL